MNENSIISGNLINTNHTVDSTTSYKVNYFDCLYISFNCGAGKLYHSFCYFSINVIVLTVNFHFKLRKKSDNYDPRLVIDKQSFCQ